MVPKKILNFETFKCPFQYRYTIDVYFGKKKNTCTVSFDDNDNDNDNFLFSIFEFTK